MTQRRLVIEPAVLGSTRSHRPLTVHVSNAMPIGACVASLAAQFGYPLADAFGTPIPYQLRPAEGGAPLPNTGCFAQVRFRSGSRFVLETALSSTATVPLPAQEPAGLPTTGQPPRQGQRVARRSVLRAGGIGLLASLGGLGTGAATRYAQRSARRAPASAMSVPRLPSPTSPPVQLALQAQFLAHQGTVRALAWSPESTLLASGGEDQQVMIWQPNTTILHTVAVPHAIGALAWSPQGQSLVAGIGSTVAFFAPQTAELLARHPLAHTAPVTALGWTQVSGHRVAISAGQDHRAVVWNGSTFGPVLVFARHTAPILALAALGEIAATASQGGVVRLWNVERGQEAHGYLSATTAALLSLSWAAPSSLLAVGGADGTVRLWPQAQQCINAGQDAFGVHCLDAPTTLSGTTRPIRTVACSPDGMLLATGGDEGLLRLWSLPHGVPLLSHAFSHPIAALAFSPSGLVLAVAAGTQVTLWHVRH